MRVRAAFAAVLMVTTFATASVASADTQAETDCGGIPCGYISPIIIIDLDEAEGSVVELVQGEGKVTLEGTVTYKFDVDREGFGAWEPSDPPEVTMRFTRKPSWLSATVEPRNFQVEMSPTHLDADTSNPTQPQADYEYSHDVTVTLEKNDQPILAEEGRDVWRMGLYARSSESGLYKPGYGYQEIRTRPVGYDRVTDRSQVEGVFASVDLADEFMEDDMSVPFHNVDIDMDVLSEIRVWKPAQFVFSVNDANGGQKLRHTDMWATVVDEHGDVHYQTGFRHPHDGRLTWNYTFPDVGRYHLLVGARPTPGTVLTSTQFQPVTAAFPVQVERSGSPSYPSSYNASFYEPLQAFAGDPGADHQFQKTIPFPVKSGASEARLSAYLRGSAYLSPRSPDQGPGQVTVAVDDPSGETLTEATLSPSNPASELTFTPSATGQHRIRIVGAGIHPVSYGVGATLGLRLHVPYDDAPTVTKDNVDHVDAGVRTVENGPVEISLEGASDVRPWKPTGLEATVDAPGEVRELSMTVVSAGGDIAFTKDVPEPKKSLAFTYPFPEPGRFLVVVSAEPLPGTGASWQTQSAAFPVLVGGDAATVEVPATYEASYEETVAQVQADTNTPQSQYDRYLPFPVHGGAETVEATVALSDPPAGSFTVELLNENGSQLDEATMDPSNPEVTLSPDALRPVDHVVHVSGTAPAGTTYGVDVGVDYGKSMIVDNPLVEDLKDQTPDPGGMLPGFEVVAVLLAAVAAVLIRREMV